MDLAAWLFAVAFLLWGIAGVLKAVRLWFLPPHADEAERARVLENLMIEVRPEYRYGDELPRAFPNNSALW